MDDAPATAPRRRVWWRYALGLVVGALVLVALFSRRGDFAGASDRLAHVRLLGAAGALGAEALSLLCYAALQRVVLATSGARVGWASLYAITLANDAIALSVPGEPAVSSVYRYRQYRARGASAAGSAWTILTVIVAQAIGLSLVLVAAILVALLGGSRQVGAGVTVLALAVVLGAGVVLARRELLVGLLEGAVRLARRLTGRPRGSVGERVDHALGSMREITMDRRATTRSVALAAGLWLADALCLTSGFYAVGAGVPWRGVLLAYGVSQIVAALPVVPGGFGLVEGSLTVLLVAYGASRVPALSAVLVYRIANYWLPIAAGWATVGVLSLRSRRGRRAGPSF
jgi:putative heme transporter